MKEKKTLKLSFSTYAVISLVVFTVLLLTFTFSYAFFASTNVTVGTITLGELDFQIINNLSTIVTEETNLLMPGEVINNSVTVLNARDINGLNIDGLATVFVRIKPVTKINNVEDNGALFVELANPTNWIAGADGFIYSIAKVFPGESLQFNEYFVLSNELNNTHQNLSVNIEIQVEAVQTENEAHFNIWQTSPQEWLDEINFS